MIEKIIEKNSLKKIKSIVDSFHVVLLEWLIPVVKARDVTHAWPI